jgi:hypothetical protein
MAQVVECLPSEHKVLSEGPEFKPWYQNIYIFVLCGKVLA